MSMASDYDEAARRVPRQERAARRVDALLDAAADVIAERGFEAATMTEIAARAGASIGAVYQYFPNKDALVLALRARYGDEMDAKWSALFAEAVDAPVEVLVERLFDLMVEFMATHPAYIPLLSVSLNYRRDAAARNQLRERFGDLFRLRQPSLQTDEAYRLAEVTLQIVKSLNVLYAPAKPKERKLLVAEYKTAVTAFLLARIG
jgi:AcrR family transcriptional regulator